MRRLGVGVGVTRPRPGLLSDLAGGGGGGSFDLTTLTERWHANEQIRNSGGGFGPGTDGQGPSQWRGALSGDGSNIFYAYASGARLPIFRSAGPLLEFRIADVDGMRLLNASGLDTTGTHHSIQFVVDPKSPATSNQSLWRIGSKFYLYIETGAGGLSSGWGFYEFATGTFFGFGDLTAGKQLLSFEFDDTLGLASLYVNNVLQGMPAMYTGSTFDGVCSLACSSAGNSSLADVDIYEIALLTSSSAITAEDRASLRSTMMTRHGL